MGGVAGKFGVTGLACCMALALAGCTLVAPPAPAPAPDQKAETAPPARPDSAPSAVAAHFAATEARRIAQGLLRMERAPRDLPISASLIERAFVEVALRDEYQIGADRILQQSSPAALRRWEAPVRLSLEFGASVPAATRERDSGMVARFAARLSRVSEHPIAVTNGRGNFTVLVLSEDERRAIAPRLRALVPGIDAASQALVEDLPLSVSCLVLAFSRDGTNTYSDAVAIIRAELPERTRDMCYFEEITQGLGLANDSPVARPSLFNDSAEFAVMTVLDEQLLRVLYDPRLRPGMREAQARPIVRMIAAELMGGQS
ncbi:DUF2927 domain-containing protein [Roseibaca sp. Y0-43]|uniref:DUF2927 domain-containing protein n=1 Tax=Roseibaca sp. Y0-43 TaxID=2816854 RepID=UPI001D0C6BD7|nr:DUF2927 domain-containing protein [Roseibaca sp. Y0-43]MCC1480626.1 DUF2927 domain-containing protein [Roseibaca sp. Y0-43]